MTNSRIAFTVAGLIIAVLGGFGLGRLTAGSDGTPISAAAPAGSPAAEYSQAPGDAPHVHAGAGATAGRSGEAAGGLAVSASGYTLVPEVTNLTRDQPREFAFRIVDADRRPVTSFAVVHDKPLHMIMVRRDLSGYQHLHPTMAPDGRWSVPLTLPAAGAWRAYADFTVAADQTAVTLGVDLTVSGAYAARPLPAPATQATAGGFTVRYEGTPVAGVTQPLLFRVDGDLERYLGAYGHLVVLREGDLGYVHVHPEPELVDGAVKFWLAAPSAGRYRMFFDFQAAGRVHTAEFTVSV